MNAVNLPGDVYLVAHLAATANGQEVAVWVADAIREFAHQALPDSRSRPATATPVSAIGATHTFIEPGECTGATYVALVLPVALEVAVALGARLSRDALVDGLRSRGVPCGGKNRAAIYRRVRYEVAAAQQVNGGEPKVRHAACCDTDLCHADRLARFPAETGGPGAQAPPRAYARVTTEDHVAQPRICDTPRGTNPDTPSNRPHGRSTGCTP